MLLSATAEGTSSRGTMAATDACQAGALRAAPQPIRKVKRSRSHGVTRPRKAAAAKALETRSMKAWAAIISVRRSKESASAPDTIASKTIGRVIDA